MPIDALLHAIPALAEPVRNEGTDAGGKIYVGDDVSAFSFSEQETAEVTTGNSKQEMRLGDIFKKIRDIELASGVEDFSNNPAIMAMQILSLGEVVPTLYMSPEVAKNYGYTVTTLDRLRDLSQQDTSYNSEIVPYLKAAYAFLKSKQESSSQVF